jgi:hypothetical protein
LPKRCDLCKWAPSAGTWPNSASGEMETHWDCMAKFIGYVVPVNEYPEAVKEIAEGCSDWKPIWPL